MVKTETGKYYSGFRAENRLEQEPSECRETLASFLRLIIFELLQCAWHCSKSFAARTYEMLTKLCEVGMIIVPIVQMKKLRHRESNFSQVTQQVKNSDNGSVQVGGDKGTYLRDRYPGDKSVGFDGLEMEYVCQALPTGIPGSWLMPVAGWQKHSL